MTSGVHRPDDPFEDGATPEVGGAAASPAISDAAAVAPWLGSLVPERTPPPGLFDRLQARIQRPAASGPAPATPSRAGGRPWLAWAETGQAGDLFAVRSSEADWEPTGYPGIMTRRLYVNPQAGRVTMLVRMAPGSFYPAHRHGGDEECFVLEGDLHVENEEFGPGDYQVARHGSIHPKQFTRGGCLLLISSSTSDELL